MSDRKDLTRWNRAGLSRFTYVNGNAVEYLELLRQQLAMKFESTNWLVPSAPVPVNEGKGEGETLLEEQKRLHLREQRVLEMYHQDRRDWAWEITRTFARACHILTGYAGAWANEGFLGTATQWENVRRLVGLLDYHPAPPSSAIALLVFYAKNAGTIAKGFQVKNSPLMGAEKVIFETLEDLFVDPALNELRPKGWNNCEEPVVKQTNNNGNSQQIGGGHRFSTVANGPIINLQGIGKGWFDLLNPDGESSVSVPKIKDFLDLDAEDAEDILGANRLNEFKTKAITICNFSLEDDWSAITDWYLPKIVAESPGDLSSRTGNALSKVEDLQLKIAQVGTYLDQEVYEKTKLEDLLVPEDRSETFSGPGSVATSWKAKQSPKVTPGQIAMICHKTKDENGLKLINKAEAAIVACVEELTGNIHLKPGFAPNNWTSWIKGETTLKVAPRWKRECWLNGSDVIRTVEPHGLNKESYIGWKVDYDLDVMSVSMPEKEKDIGRSLIRIALVDGAENGLHIRIFNDGGQMAVNKTEKADEVGNELLSGKALTALKKLDQFDEASLSHEKRQAIIGSVMECSGYTRWRNAKVTESDTRDLRLETIGPLPLEGTELYELRPIEESIFSADYEAIVLAGGEETPPSVENVTPNIEVPLEPDKPEIGSIYKLKKVIPVEIPEADGGGGGGLLPPASLPKIGCFLFPSPMLPLDLVKTAVELMLSIGVMAIPSTKEIVIKGMPFGGLLEGAGGNADVAAQQLFDLLNGLEGYVQKFTEGTPPKPLWKAIQRDMNGDPISSGGTPIIYEAYEDSDGNPKLVGESSVNGATPEFLLKDGEKVACPSSNIKVKLVEWDRKYIDTNTNNINETEIKKDLKQMLTVPEGKEATALFKKLTEELAGRGPLIAVPKDPAVKSVVQASDPPYMFNGGSKIEVGDWVAAKFTDGLRALKVGNINWFTDSDKKETFSLAFEDLEGNKELQKVYADFRDELIAEGAEVNNDKIDSDKLELEQVPESLTSGRKVLLMADSEKPVTATIVDVDNNTITIDPPASGFTKGNLIICGNVAVAGHGETKPAIILGSGNAAKSNQEFTLEVAGISFTPDATMRTGVAAALEVEVDGRVWNQVSTLKDSASDDHHYSIRMTEEGYVKILFGDGQNGRRLPSGKNNVRGRYRVGSGLAGNVEAHSLEKPVNKSPLVDSVMQPVRASSGGDMENISSLRENAPSTLLALERAVSVSDFADLATGRSNIWQAKARSVITHVGQMELVEVIVVPADGILEEESTGIREDVRMFLQAHALPGVQVKVESFLPDTDFKMNITIRVKSSEFIWTDVAKEVRNALEDRFSLKRSRLGDALYLSEVYKVVEAIKGVENSICRLVRPGLVDPQVVRPGNANLVKDVRQVVFLDPSKLAVDYEEYRP